MATVRIVWPVPVFFNSIPYEWGQYATNVDDTLALELEQKRLVVIWPVPPPP